MDENLVAVAMAVQREWKEAFETRDICRLSLLYTDPTAFYGSTPVLYTTPQGVRTYFRLLSTAYKRVEYGVPYIVRIGPNGIAATGEVTFYVEEDDGMAPRPYRMTHVLVRCDGRWKIATHHASPQPTSSK